MTVTLKIRLPRWCNVSVYNTCAEVLGSIHGSDELFVWSLNILFEVRVHPEYEILIKEMNINYINQSNFEKDNIVKYSSD